jgi:hypothetical protein
MPDKKAEEAVKKVEKKEPAARTEADIARLDAIKEEIAKLTAEQAALEKKPLVLSKEEEKKQQDMLENTDHSRTASENVEAGGHPTGSVPGGYT